MTTPTPLNFLEARTALSARLEQINQGRVPISLLLDGLSDMRNVGAMFRIADAARLKKIYLFNMPAIEQHKKLKHYARATVQYVPFEQLGTLEAVEALKQGHQLIALEWTHQSLPYTAFQQEREVVLIVGSEKMGISQDLLGVAEQSIHIPMLGINTSMNVAVATGIATYHLLNFLKQ